MNKPPQTDSPESVQPATRLLALLTNSWMTQAIYVAAQLRIADLLVDGPKTSAELAALTGTHDPSLRRLLRALVTIEICRERPDGAFELAPMGEFLRTDGPDSVRSWAIYWGEHLWSEWGHLLHSVQTGESARTLATGCDGFAHVEQDPKLAAIFNQAMVELTRIISHGVARTYDFSGAKKIVDVGGGYGELLETIIRAYPQVRGVLFDLPHAIEQGRHRLAGTEVAERCEFVVGSFFETIPPGGDIYVLKSVMHDWNDSRSRTILDNCRRVMAADTKLLLIERIMPERLEASLTHQTIVRSDLTMLVAHAAGERTEAEFRSLLGAAGFRIVRILPAELAYNVIETIPC